jgi:Cft2 family RNA processing exonuclease
MEENSNWLTLTGQRVFETQGKQFLTLPAAVEFSGLKKGALRQQMARNKVPKEDYISEDKYVFISVDYLEKVRDHSNRLKKLINLEEKHHIKFKDDDVEAFVKWKLEQKAEKSLTKKKETAPKSKKIDAKPKKKVVLK